MEETTKKEFSWIAVGLIVIILLLGIFAAWRHENSNDDVSAETKAKAELAVLMLEGTKHVLPATYADDIENVQEFISENPNVIVDRDSVHIPKSVERSFQRLETALQGVGGVGDLNPPDREVEVGQEFTIQGIITKETEAESGTDNPIGAVYKVVDEELNAELFFQFSPEVAELVDDTMLDKEVKIVIEITGIENEGVTYKVLSGPVLVSSDSK